MLLMDGVGGVDGFCANTANLWQLVGVVLLIFKIVIPIILIILGMLDLGKAVISSDDKAVSKAAKSLVMRIIAAVAIFFIPTIISFVFTLIAAFNNDVKEDFAICKTCITSPNKSKDELNSCNYFINAKGL